MYIIPISGECCYIAVLILRFYRIESSHATRTEIPKGEKSQHRVDQENNVENVPNIDSCAPCLCFPMSGIFLNSVS